MKLTTLDENTYENVLNMLNSSDKENMVLALTLIENIDFDSSYPFILLLRKMADNTSNDDWKVNAPKTVKRFKKIDVHITTVLTYRKILTCLSKQKCSIDHMQFFLNQFGKYLLNSISEVGYDFVDDLEITLKFKDNGKSKESGLISPGI